MMPHQTLYSESWQKNCLTKKSCPFGQLFRHYNRLIKEIITQFSNLSKKSVAIASHMAVASTCVIASQSLMAKTLWSDNSLSLLYGTKYELVPDNTLTTMTLEHASGHSWGGLFYFIDRHQGKTNANGKDFRETYGEISPRLYLTKFDTGLVKSINLMGTYEHGSNSNGFSQDNVLVGLGADLNIPGMKYATIGVYHAFNDNTFNSEDDQQLTLTYGWTKNKFTIDGYIDYSFNNDLSEDQLHINPQFKYNVGSLFNSSNKIDVGVEYSYWKNKFGVKGKNQSAPSLLIKAHF